MKLHDVPGNPPFEVDAKRATRCRQCNFNRPPRNGPLHKEVEKTTFIADLSQNYSFCRVFAELNVVEFNWIHIVKAFLLQEVGRESNKINH